MQNAQWGVRDCCLWPCEWVLQVTGLDGGAPWRGTYSDEAGCLAILERDGGVLAVMTRGAEEICGLARVDEARPGDVGVIRVGLSAGLGLIAAICLGPGRWAAMSGEGLRILRATTERAWRVEWLPSSSS